MLHGAHDGRKRVIVGFVVTPGHKSTRGLHTAQYTYQCLSQMCTGEKPSPEACSVEQDSVSGCSQYGADTECAGCAGQSTCGQGEEAVIHVFKHQFHVTHAESQEWGHEPSSALLFEPPDLLPCAKSMWPMLFSAKDVYAANNAVTPRNAICHFTTGASPLPAHACCSSIH